VSERPSIEDRVATIFESHDRGEEICDYYERIQVAIAALCRALVREENEAAEQIARDAATLLDENADCVAEFIAAKIAARRTTA
jgi:hypothetical protein